MKVNVLLAAVCSCIMILIMLPLFITSFRKIRRKMKAKTWKRLQRLAYVFYGLLYTHIMLLYLPSALEGKISAVVNVILYSIVYLTYGSMRISRALEKKGRQKTVAAVKILFGLVFIGLVGVVSTSFADITQTNTADHNETDNESASQEASVAYKDGKYTGAAIGYNGRLTVSVTIEDGVISEVHLKGSIDDEPYLTDATDGVFPAMIDTNSTQVDAVSNATTTSHALIEAVEDALAQAMQ